jgi:hypothetical protein
MVADEVFYSEGKLVSGRGPGIPRTALAGGDELFFTEITGNFASTATSFIDVTGLTSGAITVPEGPYVVELFAPVFMDLASQDVSMQIVVGASTLIVSDTFRSPAVNTGDLLQLKARIPFSMHTPAPGSSVTYKAQVKSSSTAATASVFVDFGGRLNPAFIRGYRV